MDHFVRTLPDGYETVLNEDSANISAGEKQLLTIARAFLADPADPDPGRGDQLGRHAYRGAHPEGHGQPDGGPHELRDRPPPVDDPRCRHDPGDEPRRIIEQGTHEELLARGGFYSELYNSQFVEPLEEAVQGSCPPTTTPPSPPSSNSAADLLGDLGADKFRFLSYRKAANEVRALARAGRALANAGRLTDIPGVGAKMALNIEQIIARGSFDALDEVSAAIPPCLPRSCRSRGRPQARGAAAREARRDNHRRPVEPRSSKGAWQRWAGSAPRPRRTSRPGVEAYARHHERTPIGAALPVAEQLVSRARSASPDAVDVQPAGSLRRREETIGDIDLVARSQEPDALISAFVGAAGVERVIAAGQTQGQR